MADLLKFISDNSSILEMVSTFFAFLFTSLIAVIAYFYRKTESKREEEIKTLRSNLKDIASHSAQAHKEIFKSIAALKDAVMQFRGELRLTHNQLDITTNGMTKMEGKVEMLATSLAQNTNELVRVGSKLEAVFRIIDAPHRRSDAQG